MFNEIESISMKIEKNPFSFVLKSFLCLRLSMQRKRSLNFLKLLLGIRMKKKRKRRTNTPLSNEFLTNNDPFAMRSKNNSF